MVFEEAISKALHETSPEQKYFTEKANVEYFYNIPIHEYPSDSDLDAAQTRLRSYLRNELLKPALLSKISGQSSFDNKSLQTFSFAFDTIIPPISIPKPTRIFELRAINIALAALFGALLGLVLLTPLTRFIFGMPDLGIVLGGPLGAFCMVLIIWRISKSKTLRRVLIASLGIASIAEIWRAVKGDAFFSGIWVLLRRKHPKKGIFKRLVLYIGIIFVLSFSKEKLAFEHLSHEEIVKSCIESWLKMAIPMIAAIQYFSTKSEKDSDNKQEVFGKLAGYIYDLHSAAQKDLPYIADELIKEAKNIGFEGLEGQPNFLSNSEKQEERMVWITSLIEKYETFGNINEGDEVKIERKPVIVGAKVLKRGLVRRIRERK